MNCLSRILQRCAGALVIAACSAGAHAAVIETTYSGWDIFGTAQHFEVRNGNRTTTGTWELGTKDGATLLTQGQHAWTSGVAQSFTVTHDLASGNLVLTIGSSQLTWDLPTQTAWGQISILAKSTGGPGSSSSTISNLMLNGVALDNDTLLATGDSLVGVNLSGEYFSDFVLTGNLTFDWTTGNPGASRMEMFVGVAQPQVVPVPAAFWLMISGLGALGAIARRRENA